MYLEQPELSPKLSLNVFSFNFVRWNKCNIDVRISFFGETIAYSDVSEIWFLPVLTAL